MASQEMLKKLLEEFDEKEAQNREEMNIINLRVEELEKRVGSSKKRLDKVGQDRQKVSEMMNRYGNGNLRNGNFVPANFVPKAVPSPSASASPTLAAASGTSPSASAAPSLASAAPSQALAQTPSVAATPSTAATAENSAAVEPWGIVKAAPPTPIIFDAALGAIAASAPLPFSSPSAAPLPFGSTASAPAGTSSATSSPSISAPMTSASAAAAAPSSPPALSVVASLSSTVQNVPAANAALKSAPAAEQAAAAASGASTEPFAPFGSPTQAESDKVALPPKPAPVPPSQTLSTSPLSSLSAASLFSSQAAPTATGDNASFNLDSGSSSSPFSSSASSSPMHTTPLSTPQGGLSQALMQSMPIGGGGTTPPVESSGGAGKFDMMDLFAPLAGEESEPESVTSEPAAGVAEQALAQNQFYSSPAADHAAKPGSVTSADVVAGGEPDKSTATQDHPSLDLGEDPASGADGEEEADDTVKSINDALRGLFR